MPVTRTSSLLESERADRARRGARRCVPPLALLAIVFVLPTIRACGRDASALDLGLKNAPTAFMAWPLFAIAAGLAWLTLVRPPEHPFSEPPRGALVAPVLTWLSCLFPAIAILQEWGARPPSVQARIVAAFALFVALPISIIAFARGLRAAGWTRWRHAITSFAAAAWLTYPAQIIFAWVTDRAERPDLRWGAYVFVAAMVWLSVAAARRD